MSYPLPTRSHLVHKAIDPGKLSAKNAHRLTELDGSPRLALYSLQKKYDGCSVIIIVDGEVDFFSRDGKEVKSLNHLAPTLRRIPKGHVLFAEAWRPGVEHRIINGEFRRQSAQLDLELRVFDIIPLADFQSGKCHVPYNSRRQILEETLYRWTKNDRRILITENCYSWEVPGLADHPDDAYDGAVAWNKLGEWKAGSGSGGEILKVKNIVDLDLEVVEVYEGEGKHAGRLGAIGVRFNDVTLRIGTGFSDAERVAWWRDPLDIKGRVVRVVVLGDSGKGSIREPRFKGIRFDKDTPDY